MLKILFLTTAHQYDDDRILHHQAKELISQGHKVKICSLSSNYLGEIEGVEIESQAILNESATGKLEYLRKLCARFNPDRIICSEPLAVIAAWLATRKSKAITVYDVTEWYPSTRMVATYPTLLKPFHALRFFLIQLFAGAVSDRYIFGEPSKKFPLSYIFPFKKKILLPYYPMKRYITEKINVLRRDSITLAYTGTFSKEKGIEHFFNAASELRTRRSSLKLNILLVGSAKGKEGEAYFDFILKKYHWENIQILPPVRLESFTESLTEADVCFDLRPITFENDHCLPIKIFYYAAAGKPVIYSNLKATRNAVDVGKFGWLVNPEDSAAIASHIESYLDSPNIYRKHALNARAAFQTKYNWDQIKASFTEFIVDSKN